MDASQQTQRIMGRTVFSNILTKQLMINNGRYISAAPPTIGGMGSNSTTLSQATGAIYTSPSEFSQIRAFQVIPPPVVNPFGSYLFSDSNTAITIPFDPEFTLGTGDFTVEWFQYLKFFNNGLVRIFSDEIGKDTPSIGLSIISGNPRTVTIQITLASIPTFVANIPKDEIVNTWVHFAIVRYSGYVLVYMNGVPICTPINTPEDLNGTSGNIYIGYSDSPEEQFAGNITSFRIINGTALYKVNFTPPSTALVSIPGTVLLLAPSTENRTVTDLSNIKKVVNSSNIAYSPSNPFV